MGTPGEYMYQAIHLYSVAVILLVMIAVILFCCYNRKNSARCRKLLVGVSVFQLAFEIAWRLIHLLNCEGIDRLLGFTGDYMFLRSGLPFVIPGVPRWITMGVFGLAVLALLSFVCDVSDSRKWIRERKKRLPKVA
jgi:hypothetical protein